MIGARSRTKAYRRDSALNRSAIQLHWSGTAGSILFTLARTCSPWLLCGRGDTSYEGWNFNSGNYLFTTDTK